MAFVFSGLRKILDLGFATTAQGGSVWAYSSSDPHATVEGAGYFAGTGYGSPSSNSVGMRVGDLVVALSVSTAGSSAVTWHRVSSLSTSTGFGSAINASVSVASS